MNPETADVATWRSNMGGHHPERPNLFHTFADICGQTDSGLLPSPQPPKHDLFAPVDPLTLVPKPEQERAWYELAKVMGWPRHRRNDRAVDSSSLADGQAAS